MMSLQSLCSAIRSQLYFSQITAWSDQLKALPLPLPREVLDNPRIIKNPQQSKARLDILFRIRSLNDEGCFSGRPQIHQFPDAIITESLSVQVCLKSLPRTAKIPILNDVPVVPSLAKVAAASLVDERKLTLCTEKGKHRCLCDTEEDSPTKEELESAIFPVPSATHREKQLQKYKRRLMKREKGRKKEESDSDEGLAQQSSSSSSSPTPSSKTTQTTTPTLLCTANTVGTQTEFELAMDCATSAIPMCDLCGSNMHLVCINCDTNNKSSSATTSSSGQSPAPLAAAHFRISEDKSEVLLRAIERAGAGKELVNNADNEEANCDKFLMDNNNDASK